jgi:hypothetical protein
MRIVIAICLNSSLNCKRKKKYVCRNKKKTRLILQEQKNMEDNSKMKQKKFVIIE